MSMYTLFDSNQFFVLGHRGYSEKYPENTLVSFKACEKDKRIDGIELDVHLCKSGEVVVAHDSNLKRVAGINKYIEDMTWDELKDIDVGSFKDKQYSDARMILLSDLFNVFGARFIYDIELKVEKGQKYKKLCNAVWSLVCAYSLEEKVMVSSFNPFALRYFNKVCMLSVPTADIYDNSKSIPKILRSGWGHKISQSSYSKPEKSLINSDFAKKLSLEIVTWTVNTESEARKIASIKGLKGFIGNNPVLLAGIKEELLKNK